jgi:hypothetical protein
MSQGATWQLHAIQGGYALATRLPRFARNDIFLFICQQLSSFQYQLALVFNECLMWVGDCIASAYVINVSPM